MKKNIYLIVATIMMTLASTTLRAANIVAPTTTYSTEAIATMTVEQKQLRIEQIKDRVEEIKSMDKSNMTREDKKALRVELRSMRHEAQAIRSSSGMGGGIYLSVGAIIIIILLLILIL